MAELADALDSKSSGSPRAGSSPASGSKNMSTSNLFHWEKSEVLFLCDKLGERLLCLMEEICRIRQKMYEFAPYSNIVYKYAILEKFNLHLVEDNVKLNVYQYLYP